jgi:hypothetical protein
MMKTIDKDIETNSGLKVKAGVKAGGLSHVNHNRLASQIA